MKIKILIPFFFLSFLFACKSNKTLVRENKNLKSIITIQHAVLDTLMELQRKDQELLAEVKTKIQEMSDAVSRLEVENSDLKYHFVEAEEKLKKMQKPLLGGLYVTGMDTIHKKGHFYSENNQVGKFQVIQIKFSVFENPAIQIPVEDTAWIGMEDSLHNSIPITVKSKFGFTKGNMAGIEIISDGELHFVKYYIAPVSSIQLKPGYYRFSLNSGEKLRDLYGVRFE